MSVVATTLDKFSVSIIKNGLELLFQQSDIIELNIFEDIFDFSMTGMLKFYDKTGYTEKLELTGHDVVVVTYMVENNQVQKMFVVYDFNRVNSEVQGASIIQLSTWYLVEPYFMSLTNRRYSKSWANKTGSDIISDISRNMLGIEKFKYFEAANERLETFCMPYWTPAETIKWIMRRLSGVESKAPGYLFYSNKYGINFITLESLINKKDREKDNNGNNVKYILSGGEDDYSKIISWSLNPTDLHSTKYLAGTTKYGYNSKTKDIYQQKYKYKDAINKFSLLGSSALFPDMSDTTPTISIEGESDPKLIDNIFYGDFIKRYSKQFSASIVVRGHSRRYAGMLVDMVWKSADEKSITNKMLDGLFLVRSITHQFTTGGIVTPNYRQLMVCLKIGYGSTNYKQLLKANKVIRDTQIMAGNK